MLYREGNSYVDYLDEPNITEISLFTHTTSWDTSQIDVLVPWHREPSCLQHLFNTIPGYLNVILCFPPEARNYYIDIHDSAFSFLCRGRLRGESLLLAYQKLYNRVCFYMLGDEAADLSVFHDLRQSSFPYDVILAKKVDRILGRDSKRYTLEIRGGNPSNLIKKQGNVHSQFALRSESGGHLFLQINIRHNHILGIDYAIKVAQNSANEYEYLNYNANYGYFLRRFLWGEFLSSYRVFAQARPRYYMLFLAIRMVSFFSALYVYLYLRTGASQDETTVSHT
jgi:hypothetical protein